MSCPRFHCLVICISAAAIFPALRNMGTNSERIIPSTKLTVDQNTDKTDEIVSQPDEIVGQPDEIVGQPKVNSDANNQKYRARNPIKFSDCIGLGNGSRHPNSKSLFCTLFGEFQGEDKKIPKKSTEFVKKAMSRSSENVVDKERTERNDSVYDHARMNKNNNIHRDDSLIFLDTRQYEAVPKEERFKRLTRGRQQQCRPNLPVTYADNEPLPWTCRQRKQWRALPDIYYPNRLHETVCESSSCMNGHFNCTPVTYTTHLLRVCYDNQCNDDRVPYSLRNTWIFVDYQLTVGCTCSR